MMTDVLIIGAGLAGLSAALACRDAGLDFRVLEAGARQLHQPQVRQGLEHVEPAGTDEVVRDDDHLDLGGDLVGQRLDEVPEDEPDPVGQVGEAVQQVGRGDGDREQAFRPSQACWPAVARHGTRPRAAP